MTIEINGITYVEKNYDKIIYSNWSPRAFVLGFAVGSAIMSVFMFSIIYSHIG